MFAASASTNKNRHCPTLETCKAADPQSLRPAFRWAAPEAPEVPDRRTGRTLGPGGPSGPGAGTEGRFWSFTLQSQGVENRETDMGDVGSGS